MVRPIRSYSMSAAAGVRSHPKERALREGHALRLRSGSAGAGQRAKLRRANTEVKDEDVVGEPIEVHPDYLLELFFKGP